MSKEKRIVWSFIHAGKSYCLDHCPPGAEIKIFEDEREENKEPACCICGAISKEPLEIIITSKES